ncbi:MAG: hypothetical protein NZ843_05375 [Fimbriimonadales bacterium]|nr:hypothetical protein [Fimbriimonadales bacterium]
MCRPESGAGARLVQTSRSDCPSAETPHAPSRSVGISPTMWLGRLAQAKRGLDSLVQAVASASSPTQARTVASVLHCAGFQPLPSGRVGETPTWDTEGDRSRSHATKPAYEG